MNIKKIKKYAAAFGAALFWGISFVWSKSALAYFYPSTVIFFRLLISVIFLFSIGKATGMLKRLTKKQLKDVALLTLFEPFLYFVGESYGLFYSSSTTAAVVIATIPLIAPFFAAIFLNEKIVALQVVGAVISIAGVAMVIMNKDFSLNATPVGILFLFMAVISAVAYSVVVAKMSSDINIFTIVSYQSLLGVLFFLPMVLIFDFEKTIRAEYSWQSLAPIIQLGVFASSLAFIFFTYSIKQLGIVKASTFTNIIPVFTAIFAYFILDERLTLLNISGMAIVVCGLFIVQIKKRKHIKT